MLIKVYLSDGLVCFKEGEAWHTVQNVRFISKSFFFLNAALDIIGVFEELSVNLKIIKNPDVLISVFEHACLLHTTHIKTITRNYFIKERKKSFLTKLS